jgi:2-keto-4-pentenoate hydratase
VKDVTALRKKMKAIFPVIELTNSHFKAMKNKKSVDLITSLAGSAKYIVGKTVPVPQVNVDQIGSCLEGLGGEADPIELVIPMSRNGQIVNEGKCKDALGGQCQALLWLVNAVIKRGWAIEPGYIFLTGPLGQPILGEPGEYAAGYGILGAVSFVVK